jgi:hypothetical protein
MEWKRSRNPMRQASLNLAECGRAKILTLDRDPIACGDHQWPATNDRSGASRAVRVIRSKRPLWVDSSGSLVLSKRPFGSLQRPFPQLLMHFRRGWLNVVI